MEQEILALLNLLKASNLQLIEQLSNYFCQSSQSNNAKSKSDQPNVTSSVYRDMTT